MYVGPSKRHGNFEGEAVGAILGVHLLTKEYIEDNAKVEMWIDNTATIAGTQQINNRSGQYLFELFHREAGKLDLIQRGGTLTVSWISSHSNVNGNEEADREAKKAANGDSSKPRSLPKSLTSLRIRPPGKELPHNLSTVKMTEKKRTTEKWTRRWQKSKRHKA